MMNRQQACVRALKWLLGVGVWLVQAMVWSAEPLTPEQARQRARQTSPKLRSASAEPIAAELALPEALALALAGNAELAALRNELGASDAAIAQAGVLPNPTLAVRAENLGNSRVGRDGDRATSIEFGQLIERGGKRAARVKIAETDRDLARWNYQAKVLEVQSQVRQAFVDVLASQQKLALVAQSATLAQQFADAVGKRVTAGKVSPVEETKARLELSATQIEREQAKRELESARNRLGATWNNPAPRFERAVGDLEQLTPLPDYAQLSRRIRDNPDLARWRSEIASRKAVIDAERAKAVPDLSIGAGVSRFSRFDDHAYTVNLSLPLPLFDRNRGGVLAANRRLDKTMDERRAAENRIAAELTQAYSRLAAIRNEVQTLRSSVLPGAQSAFDAANKGYQLGKFGFLDVLDAQRTLFRARAQHLRALPDYHRGTNEIERLIGAPLDKPARQAVTKE
jgi:outer membrane protein, heavy metal efflux system